MVPGTHNALNAVGALEAAQIACRGAGAEIEPAIAALAEFRGAGRRFQLVGASAAGAAIYGSMIPIPPGKSRNSSIRFRPM